MPLVCIFALGKDSVLFLENTRSSAVGSALRSGRRGRVFESRLLDLQKVDRIPFIPGILSTFIIWMLD